MDFFVSWFCVFFRSTGATFASGVDTKLITNLKKSGFERYTFARQDVQRRHKGLTQISRMFIPIALRVVSDVLLTPGIVGY